MLRLDRIETISCIVESEETESWRSSHPENWTSVQVQEWILWFSLNYLDAGLENVQTEHFSDVTGRDAFTMKRADWLRRDAEFGAKLYEAFNKMKDEGKWSCDIYVQVGHG